MCYGHHDAIGDDAEVDAMLVLLRRQGEQAGAVLSDDAHATLKGEFDEVGAVRNGMPSVMTTMSPIPASTASTTAPLANRGGTKTTLAWAPVASLASAHVAYTGTETSLPLTRGLERHLAARLARVDAADDVRTGTEHAGGVSCPDARSCLGR